MSGAPRCDDDDCSPPDEDSEFRSDNEGEEVMETDLETLRRELNEEISELEWEFKAVKEALYHERIFQIDRKLQLFKSSEAPELKQISALVDEAYHIRCQVAKYRRDFELEVANKELDNALQMATCDAEENLRIAEERIRIRLQESICTLQIERALANRRKRISHAAKSKTKVPSFDASHGRRHKDFPKSLNYNFTTTSEQVGSLLTAPAPLAAGDMEDDYNETYLPSQDLEPRRKPVALPPSLPRLIYELDEEDIQADLQAIMNAVKEHKIALAVAQMNAEKRES
ncbi:hypothetical protein AAHC03_01335 [Spirometra sp. Aus1]|nr:unnamed protein product [Spirometra erinaceieuropaei]